MNRFLFIASTALLLVFTLIWWLEESAIKPVSITPTLTGEAEYCLTCHADIPEISSSHPVEAFGCVLCHGGERLALDADLAHSSMRGGKNPSDLNVVEQSCGGQDCHSGSVESGRDHIQRVVTSIQSTYTGAITSLRYTFGAQPDQSPRFATVSIQDTTLPSATGILSLEAFQPENEEHPLLQAFGKNCLNCHLNAAPPPGQVYQRLTGCAACHSPALPAPTGEVQPVLHRLTTAMPYTQCNTCHNRGNYELRSMTFVERSDQPVTRLQAYYQPIAQFTLCEYTLDCIDCHTRLEAMGDGDLHAAQADIQYVQCKTCHGDLNNLPLTLTLDKSLELVFRLVRLNPLFDLQPGDTILITEQGEPLWNTRLMPNGAYELIGKAIRQRFIIHPVMGSACEQDPAQQESQYCHTCHALQR